ncbi:hypothetical protein R1sor_027382 [Riccia sorocarpa]|uniref:Transmembrane protein 70 n=1 Tax=Riccia sorocarpa TaxID=122646 RepID=A0ABD3GJS5_9MARC
MAMSGAGRYLMRAGSRQMLSDNQIIRSALVPQERWASLYPSKGFADYSNGTNLKERDEKKGTVRPLVYIGAMSDTVRRVKMLSLSTCCLSVFGGPFVTFFTNPELSVIMKGALCSTMVVLSASTTFALHWFASPYIHKLTWVPGSNEVDVEVLSWLATKLKRKIKLSDIRTPYTQRPLVTFAANNEYYFIDKDSFPNKELLDKLLPEKRKQ